MEADKTPAEEPTIRSLLERLEQATPPIEIRQPTPPTGSTADEVAQAAAKDGRVPPPQRIEPPSGPAPRVPAPAASEERALRSALDMLSAPPTALSAPPTAPERQATPVPSAPGTRPLSAGLPAAAPLQPRSEPAAPGRSIAVVWVLAGLLGGLLLVAAGAWMMLERLAPQQLSTALGGMAAKPALPAPVERSRATAPTESAATVSSAMAVPTASAAPRSDLAKPAATAGALPGPAEPLRIAEVALAPSAPNKPVAASTSPTIAQASPQASETQAPTRAPQPEAPQAAIIGESAPASPPPAPSALPAPRAVAEPVSPPAAPPASLPATAVQGPPPAAAASASPPEAPPARTIAAAPPKPVYAEAKLLVAPTLSARIGAAVPLAVAVETGGRPASALSIVVTGLPAGAELSAGQTRTAGGWSVPLGSLDGLKLGTGRLPPGTHTAAYELLDGEGNSLARGATRILLQPPEPPPPPKEAEGASLLVERGRALLKTGDVAAARLVLERAAEGNSATGALLLGETYDPSVLLNLKAFGMAGDVRKARRWYERAKELGAREAEDRLRALTGQ